MRRLAVFGITICFFLMLAVLSQTARDPDIFTGQWDSVEDQRVFLFRDGLIYSAEHLVPLSDTDSFSGAYHFGKDSIMLFVTGVEGLAVEKELFYVSNRDGSFLCEHKDGTGEIYFIRHTK